MRIKNESKIDVVVNKNNWLSKAYIPVDLTEPNVSFLSDTNPEARFLRKECAKSLEKLFKKLKKKK